MAALNPTPGVAGWNIAGEEENPYIKGNKRDDLIWVRAFNVVMK